VDITAKHLSHAALWQTPLHHTRHRRRLLTAPHAHRSPATHPLLIQDQRINVALLALAVQPAHLHDLVARQQRLDHHPARAMHAVFAAPATLVLRGLRLRIGGALQNLPDHLRALLLPLHHALNADPRPPTPSKRAASAECASAADLARDAQQHQRVVVWPHEFALVHVAQRGVLCVYGRPAIHRRVVLVPLFAHRRSAQLQHLFLLAQIIQAALLRLVRADCASLRE